MRKLQFLIFFIVAFCGIFLLAEKVSAQRVELYLDIKNPSITAGEAVSGKVLAKVYAGFGNTPSNCNIGVDFELFSVDSPPLTFSCNYDPATGGVEGYAACEQNFTHVYLTPGEKTIIAYASCGGPGLVAIKRAQITVSERPVTPALLGFESPLEATTIEEVIRRTTSIIYWIGASIAIIMILLGGFYLLTSGGNPKQIMRGKQIIFYALIGLAFITLARGIIELINAIIGVR
jgi:hypothetical protein